MKIDKNRKYTTRDGREVRIYATDGDGVYKVHGAILIDNQWTLRQWLPNGNWTEGISESRNDLIEAVKPNGIPVDIPDPPEVEGYTWEPRGWGWKCGKEGLRGASIMNDMGYWVGHLLSTYEAAGSNDHFYVEYIPIAVTEMTLAEVCEKLGKTIKIIK